MNLILDPEFEAADLSTQWATQFNAPGGGESVALDTGTVYSGANSLKVVAAGGGPFLGRRQTIALPSAELDYIISGWVNVTAHTSGTVALEVSGGTLASQSVAAVTSGWSSLKETFTKPDATTSITIDCVVGSTATLTAYYDALVLERADTETFITDIYERELEKICQQYDWFVEREDISAVLDQSIYAMQASAVRPLAVIHNNIMLEKATSWALDQQSDTWQTDASGTPNYWLFDQIPAALDGLASVTTDKFAIHPPPDANGSGESGLQVYETAVPSSFEPTLTWLDEYLAVKTASEVIRQNEIDRRLDMESDNLALSQFYGQVADMWIGVLAGLVPR